MSECEYDYRFYFSTPAAGQAAIAKTKNIIDDDAKAEALGFAPHINEDIECLELVDVNQAYCRLTFTTSTSAGFNHRLVRASKELGSEFAITTVFNSQVGEGDTFFTLRGREVSGQQCEELLAQYKPHEKLQDALCNGDLTFIKQAIQQGLDVNSRIDDQSLLEIALRAEQLNAFKLLLKYKAEVNVATANEPSLLMYAVKNLAPSDADYAILLVKLGGDVNICDCEGASVLWYVWRVSKPLHRMLVKQGVKLIPPSGAYGGNEMDNLTTALKAGDQTQIIKYFKLSAKHKNNWATIASHCIANDYIEPFNVLVKNGYLQGDEHHATCRKLLQHAAYHSSLNGFCAVLDIVENKRIDITDSVAALFQELLAIKNAESLLTRLAHSYPQVLTPAAFGKIVQCNHTAYLSLLFKTAPPFEAYEKERDIPLLHDLIADMTLPTLEFLVAAGMDLSQQYDDESIIEYCIDDEDVDVNVRQYLFDHTPDAPPHLIAFASVRANDLALLQRTWSRLDDKDILNDDEHSLLMAACANPNSTLAPFLLAQGVNVRFKNDDEETAFGIAYEARAYNNIALLIQHGISPDVEYPVDTENDEDDEQTSAIMSMMGLNNDAANPFVRALESAIVLSPGATYLMAAAKAGDTTLFSTLIENGASLWQKDSSNQDALVYAIVNNKRPCLDIILRADDAKKNALARGAELISLAALAGNDYAVSRLLAMGVSANAELEEIMLTPLIAAALLSAYHDNYHTVDILLNGGALPGKTNSKGKTALIYAGIVGDQTLIAKLLTAGADPDHIDAEAKTAFDYFVMHKEPAAEFSIAALQPKSKMVGVYKTLIALGTVIKKWIIPAFVIFSSVAYFAPTYALYGMLLVLFASAIKVGLAVKGGSIVTENDSDNTANKKPGKAATNMFARGLEVMGKAMAENERQARENQAIIDSWNDDTINKPMEG